ncbi:MAG TPA: pteridine reductase [Xanthomonadaceae bacterium]|nr:pteridine reductase [Xanthomonadaceae bacterium]
MAQTPPVALVTGAARRVGAVIARTLHGAGYELALHYRNSAREVADLQAELEAIRPRSTLVLRADLSHTPSLADLVGSVVAHFGGLDALVNNASAFYPTPVGHIEEKHWDELFASNARAPLFLAQAAAPYLKSRAGAIVNLADIYADRPLARHTVYCMAKAALVMATRSLARELGPEVRVNAVSPGAVLWPESGGTYTDPQALVEATALKRTGTPEDVAAAVLWLLREARFTTGEVIRVDGGRTLSI